MKKNIICLVLALALIIAVGGVVGAQDSPIAVTGVSLNLTQIDMVVGDCRQLEAIISPTGATNTGVSWTSSNTSVASVTQVSAADDTIARVCGVAPGTATIVASTEDGGYTATATVTVRAATTTPPTGGSSTAVYMVLAGILVTATALTMRRLKDQIV